jgi:small subunit ribosomal protein S9
VSDEERNDEQPEETPAEETPEEAPAVGTPAEETSAEPEAETPTEVEPPAGDADSTASDDAGGVAEDGSSDGEAVEPPAAEEAAPPEVEKKEDKKEKKEEVVPGAELDPIALEPERELSAEEKARRDAEEEERAKREAELTSEAPDDAPLAAKPTKLEGDARFLATGKRKSSVARVILTAGKGSIEVNKRQLEEYFPRSYLQTVAKQALTQSGYEGNVDVRVRVHGGGISGQAAAVRHGIARALCDVDPELRPELKRRGMLTRDARVKERRKAGLKKARKKPQFSKR